MVIYFNVVSSIVHDSFLKSVSYEIPTKESGLFYWSYISVSDTTLSGHISDMSKYMFGDTLETH